MDTLTQPGTSHQNTVWNVTSIVGLFELPFMDLLFQAQQIHRAHHKPNEIQLSSLLSIKTGGCAEDCSYCPQSARYNTEVKAEKLMPLEEVVNAAKSARDNGAQRFCMGAAWRNPKPHQLDEIAKMITAVKELGMETCVTLGMLQEGQAEQLRDAGLDYYNHNLDTSPSSMVKSLPPALMKTAWKPWKEYVMPDSMCAAVVLWGWENPAGNAQA